jgi:hypothetical protein
MRRPCAAHCLFVAYSRLAPPKALGPTRFMAHVHHRVDRAARHHLRPPAAFFSVYIASSARAMP